MDVSLFAFFRADISDALRYLHNCLVRITEIVQLLASGHKMNGCLQLPDLQFLSTDSCTDGEEAGNSRTHQMQSRNPWDKNSYPSAICAWMRMIVS